MARVHTVAFTIKPDGTIEYEVKGVKGSGCEAIAKAFEPLGTLQRDGKTREFYERPTDVQITGRH